MSKPVGLHCPSCGKRMLRTVDSRPIANAVKRRKECVSCGKRVTTIETVKAGK